MWSLISPSLVFLSQCLPLFLCLSVSLTPSLFVCLPLSHSKFTLSLSLPISLCISVYFYHSITHCLGLYCLSVSQSLYLSLSLNLSLCVSFYSLTLSHSLGLSLLLLSHCLCLSLSSLTALHYAVLANSQQCTQLLVHNKYITHVPSADDKSVTPLMIAADNGFNDIVQVISLLHTINN